MSEAPLYLVGVKLGDISGSLIEVSVALGCRAGARLHLVHFCAPWNTLSWAAAYPEGGVSLELSRFTEMRFIEDAQKSLKNLVSSFPKELEVTSHVVLGSPIEGLEEEATRVGASLIICGSSFQDRRFFLSGFSTALGVMAASSLPVLVIPEDTEWRKNGPYTVLLCDDMSSTGREVIRQGHKFGAVLGNVRYLHLNVCSITDSEMTHMTEYLAQAVSAGIVEHDASYSPYQTLKNTKEQRVKELRERFYDLGGLPSAHFERYEAICAHGDVVEAIQDLHRSREVDLVIMGGHEAAHSRAFTLNKVPYRAMVGLGSPVLMVPSATS